MNHKFLFLFGSTEELEELIENRRVRMSIKQLLESEDDDTEEVIPALPSKLGAQRKSMYLKKIAIEVSKKLSELGILNSERFDDEIIAELKKKNSKLLRRNEILEELNISLQKEVIDKMRDFKMTASLRDDSVKPETPEVGKVINDEVHIGQGIYLKKGTYNSCLVSARSGAQFVKNIAVALYGIDVLRNSSVTGKASNRIKEKEARPPLDSNKLQAIRDIYKHYLQQKGQDGVSLDYDLSQIGSYISSKISDLNRVSRTAKTTEVKENQIEESEMEKTLNLPEEGMWERSDTISEADLNSCSDSN